MSHHQRPLKNCLSRLATLVFQFIETGNSVFKIIHFFNYLKEKYEIDPLPIITKTSTGVYSPTDALVIDHNERNFVEIYHFYGT